MSEPTLWIEPKNIKEAEERRLRLAEEIGNIESQLGPYEIKKTKIDQSTGRNVDLTDDEYIEWRQKAKVAREKRHNDLRRVNHWLKLHRGTVVDHLAQKGLFVEAVVD